MDMRLPPDIAAAEPMSLAMTGDPEFSYAFQPVVDTVAREIFSYEALIRGPANEPAYSVLARVPPHRKYPFDQESRIAAIALAVRLGCNCHLNLNLLPKSVHSSVESIRSTLAAAARHGLPAERLILEVNETEVIDDHARFNSLLSEFRAVGLKFAIDDFGAGHSGLNLLAEFQPDQVKIDMNLVRGIEHHGPRQAIVRAIAQACGDLGIDVVAEGVETVSEFRWFTDIGIRLFQGYLFARPGFEHLPDAHFP